jgi:hypothetical protein
MAEHIERTCRVLLTNDDYDLVENAVGMGVFAKRAFAANTLYCALQFGPVQAQPSRYTIQLGSRLHAEPLPTALRYVNHSCDPNLYFDIGERVVMTLRPIAEGDELTFFYPSTEWQMVEPFECECGTSRCLRRIAGASQLSARTLEGYRLSSVVQELTRTVQKPDSGKRSQ